MKRTPDSIAFVLFWIGLVHRAISQEISCAVPLNSRRTCGLGSEQSCIDRGCCYDNVGLDGIPSCFFPAGREPRFGDWSEWTACNAPCGTLGTQIRRKQCFYHDDRPAPTALCSGPFEEEEPCNRISCSDGGVLAPSVASTTTTTTTTAVVATTAVCRDLLSGCSNYKRFCQIPNDLGRRMKSICRKTCGTCDSQTISSPSANNQSVSTAPLTVTSTIVTSTSSTLPTITLPPTKYPISQCADEFPIRCPEIVSLCRNETYIEDARRYCRKSCGFCEQNVSRTDPPQTETGVIRTPPPLVIGGSPISIRTPPRLTINGSPIRNPPRRTIFGNRIPPRPLNSVNRPRPVRMNSRRKIPLTQLNSGKCEDSKRFCPGIKPKCKDKRFSKVAQMCKKTCELCKASPSVLSNGEQEKMRPLTSPNSKNIQNSSADRNQLIHSITASSRSLNLSLNNTTSAVTSPIPATTVPSAGNEQTTQDTCKDQSNLCKQVSDYLCTTFGYIRAQCAKSCSACP